VDGRIKVNEKQLAAAIAGWLRHIPKRVWEQFIEHKILQHYKRSSLSAVQLESEIANHVASEMTRLDWQVSYPEPAHPGSRRPGPRGLWINPSRENLAPEQQVTELNRISGKPIYGLRRRSTE
jgi:hypothetical protein